MKYLNSSLTDGCLQWIFLHISKQWLCQPSKVGVQYPHLSVHLQNICTPAHVLCLHCVQQLELLRNSPFSVICSLVGLVGEMPFLVCTL